MAEFRNKLNDFAMKNIFKVDETGLSTSFHREKTYICTSENRKFDRGIKSMNVQGRITAYATRDGTSKNDEYVLYKKTKSPTCLTFQRPSNM